MASNDFSMYSGDSKTLQVTVTDQNNNPINITGATLTWVLVNGQSTVLRKTSNSGGGITITSATAGQFQIQITGQDTTNLSAGTYTHECRMVDSSNNSSVIFVGSVTITKSFV